MRGGPGPIEYEWKTHKMGHASTLCAQERRSSPHLKTSQHLRPGQSLQEVLARAQPGDILSLPEGVWEGPLVVEGPGLTLRAERGHRVEIVSATDAPAVVVKGHVHLENLRIRGASESMPVVLVQSGRPRFRDCVLTCPGGGLIAQAGASVTMADCVVEDCVYGTGLQLDACKALLQGAAPSRCSRSLWRVSEPSMAVRTGACR